MSPAQAAPADTDLAAGRGRLRVLGLGLGIAFAVIGWRLIDLVEWRSDRHLGGPMVAAAHAAPHPDFAAAGGAARYDIVDRNGVLLATNLRVPAVTADPALIPDKASAAIILAKVLADVDAEALRQRLEKGGRFAWVKHQITPDEQQAVLELGIPGVGFDHAAEHRVYPKRALASHLVGFVNVDNRGMSGVERSLDQRLDSTSGNGPVPLSLDVRVQQILHEELSGAMRRYRAKGAGGVVLDRETGEVLALVSLPDFDPNRPELASEEQKLNRVTGGAYELGSLFKMFSSVVALDSGAVRLGDKFDATKPLQIGRRRIRDDHAKNRWLAVPECFMYSSNICTARMVFAAGGGPAMRSYFDKLGFYERPRIELPPKELARPLYPQRWPDITVATVSFGHGIAISPLQFTRALGGLVGDGRMVPTTLLARRTPPTGAVQVASASTVEAMRWLMWLTVEKGSGSHARSDAYLVGGKTGTADKPILGGRGYHQGAVIASFAGVFPLERPRYVVLAMLDEPQGDAENGRSRYGGMTAAPVVAAVIERSGPILDVGPSDRAVAQAWERRWEAAFGDEARPEEHLAAAGPVR